MKTRWQTAFILAVAWVFLGAGAAFPAHDREPPLTGYTLHFDFLNSLADARQLVEVAEQAGAGVINLVPPAHVWERPDAQRLLDEVLALIEERKLKVIIARVDASYPADAQGQRFNYVYGNLLTEPGRMPDGSPSTPYFYATVGRPDYDRWMEEETRYYAERYGHRSNLLGFNVGPFSEPFVSQRGGFLEFSESTGVYEITQYTPEARKEFHGWLRRHYGSVQQVNRQYGTAFHKIEDIPLPLNDADSRFTEAGRAYSDFAAMLNDWLVTRYERCRTLWHSVSGRRDVPFIFQLSGFDDEKIQLGRPALKQFDIDGWIRRADAVGLSLYTNAGYADWGHASILAMIDRIRRASIAGEPVFVLESGCEAPTAILKMPELDFVWNAVRPLAPRTFIYEFLKDTINEPEIAPSGKLISEDGRIRSRALESLKAFMAHVRE